MKTNQIIDALNTMSRDELRAVATHLNVPRGKDKPNTVANLTKAIENGQARFKIQFTIKTNPPEGQTYGSRKLFVKKLRTYGEDKVLIGAPTLPQPLAVVAAAA